MFFFSFLINNFARCLHYNSFCNTFFRIYRFEFMLLLSRILMVMMKCWRYYQKYRQVKLKMSSLCKKKKSNRVPVCPKFEIAEATQKKISLSSEYFRKKLTSCYSIECILWIYWRKKIEINILLLFIDGLGQNDQLGIS